MSSSNPTFDLTFLALVRLTAKVRANSPKEAHFMAFTDAAGVLQNDPLVRKQLGEYGLRAVSLDPVRLVHCSQINESADHA